MVRKQVVQITEHSDGDLSHAPPSADWKLSNPDIYLQKLAVQWLQARGDEVLPGMTRPTDLV